MGEPLLIIGRQVPTAFGGFIDLLALDETGSVHVIELKRDKTPRDVTAQALDYGSWVAGLERAQILEIFSSYSNGVALEAAFGAQFGSTLPEELNTAQVLTIVAATVDRATERIVRFLNETFDVPINVVFFRHFIDNGASYLARTWLVQHEGASTASGAAGTRRTRTREPWNGTDWYVAYGDDSTSRNWDDARQYGFVSGGGGKWYSQTLKNLPVGARVFVHIPKSGYVGVGTVTAEALPFDQAQVQFGEATAALRDQPLAGNYGYDDDENAEWVVPVQWIHTVSKEEAFWKAGMFANQNTATKLRQQYTIEEVSAAFGLDA